MSFELPSRELELGDSDLIQTAIDLVNQQQLFPDRHRIGSVLLTESGEIFSGVCIQAEYVKPTGVCGERIALGRWATDGCDSLVTTIVSVRKPRPVEDDQTVKVAMSCGMCREILTDYFPEAEIIAPTREGKLARFMIVDSLPPKYQSVARES
jgi:cytidine deaminase